MFTVLKTSKNTIFELTRKQVKVQYRDSTLGFLWTILNPLLNMLVMWLVFQSVLGITDPYYPIYILAGNVLFGALRNSTSQALQSIVNNRGLLLRTKIELEVFPLSDVLSSIVNFGFSLIAIVPFMIWLTIQQGINLFSYQLVFILLMIPAFTLFEYGIGLFLSVLFVFFRDIKHIYGVFLTLWMYLTPLFYPITRLDPNGTVLKIIKLNPMFHFVNYFRDCIYRGAAGIDVFGKTVGAYVPLWETLGIIYLCGVISFIIGFVFFKLLKSKVITRI